jgi:hypothetical protein
MKNPQDMDKQMGMMYESMLKMHEQMHKIMDAKNPHEQVPLVQGHRHMLHQHMSAMKDGGMMGGDAKSGMGTVKEQKGGEKHK